MATAKKPTPRTSPFSTTNQTAAFNPPRASFSTTTPTRRTTTGTTSTPHQRGSRRTSPGP